jgi:UDP-2,3-diacylglucosamine hydrolase
LIAGMGESTQRIAILAGGGKLPLALAERIVRHGGRAHIVAVRGEAGPAVEAYPHTWVTWGALNAILAALRRESDGTMMIAGSVSRPDLMRLKPDFGLFRHLPKVLAMLRGGDDAVLTRVIRFFESQGLTVKGVGEVAPELLAPLGDLGAMRQVSSVSESDIRRGFEVLDVLADLDVGQAIAVENGRVLAIEGVEGTDRMLARIAGLPDRASTGGVLVKGPKRGQELRVDIPAVGAQTIAALAEAQLSTLVVAAGKTLFLEQDEMVRRAADVGITISARDRTLDDGAAVARKQHDSARAAASATMLGRLRPGRADAGDVRTAAEVVERLRPFGTGHAAVVVRDHVLAIASAESVADMARRMSALRQWGRGRFRHAIGAAGVRLSAIGSDQRELVAVIDALAAGGIAGLAVLTPDRKTVIDGSIVAAADRHGMFLVQLADRPAGVAAEAA